MTDYRVVTRAVRGPMRRWWRQTGVWWLLLIAALLVLYGFLLHQAKPPGQFHAHISAFRLQWGQDNLVYHGVIAACSLLWFLAALQTRHIMDSLCRELPDTMVWSRFTLYRFGLALFAGWWALIPVILLVGIQTVDNAVRNAAHIGSGVELSQFWAITIGRCNVLPEFAVGLLFVAALVALPWVSVRFAWLWWSILSLSGLLNAVLYILIDRIYECARFPVQLPWLGYVLAALGVLISLVPLFLLVRGRLHRGQVTAAILAVLVLMDRLHLGCPKIWSFGFNDVSVAIDFVLYHLYRMPLLAPAWTWYGLHWEPAGTTLGIDNRLLGATLDLARACLVLMGHYFLVRWVITPKHATSPESNTSRI